MTNSTSDIVERIRKVMRLARRAATEGERDAALSAAKRLAKVSGVSIEVLDVDIEETVMIRDSSSEAKTSNVGTEVNLAIQMLFKHFGIRVILDFHRGGRTLTRRVGFTWIGNRINIGVAKYAYEIMIRESRKEWRKVKGWGIKKGAFMLGFFYGIDQELENNPLRNDIDKLKAEGEAAERRMQDLIKQDKIRYKKSQDLKKHAKDGYSLMRGFESAEHVKFSRPMEGRESETLVPRVR